MGCLRQVPRGFWRDLRTAGVEVRCSNQPRLGNPLGWMNRNHHKVFRVDGTAGSVSRLCVGGAWVGDPARRVPAWRSTGLALQKPALAGLHAAFAEIWPHAGGRPRALAAAIPPAPPSEMPSQAGPASPRAIASKPDTTGLCRFDQLAAGMARQPLWPTDACFAGATAHVHALCGAALDGVDVRLLVPDASDIAVFESDLQDAAEVLLDLARMHPAAPRPRRRPVWRGRLERLAAGAVGLGSAATAAFAN